MVIFFFFSFLLFSMCLSSYQGKFSVVLSFKRTNSEPKGLPLTCQWCLRLSRDRGWLFLSFIVYVHLQAVPSRLQLKLGGHLQTVYCLIHISTPRLEPGLKSWWVERFEQPHFPTNNTCQLNFYRSWQYNTSIKSIICITWPCYWVPESLCSVLPWHDDIPSLILSVSDINWLFIIHCCMVSIARSLHHHLSII